MKIADYLANVKGSRIVALRTKTQEKLLVKSKEKFPKGISKISVRNGIIGANYENAVNNKMAKNSDDIENLPHFEAESLWKGKGRSIDNYLAEHVETGEKYLKFLPKTDADNHNRTKSIWIDNATGEEVRQEDFAEFKGKSSPFSSSGVNWQVIKLSNIIGFGDIDIES